MTHSEQKLEGNIHIFHQRRNKNRGKTIHCFFEGKDDRFFYLDFVEAIFKGYQVFYYSCENKGFVYKTRDKMVAEQARIPKFSMSQLLFFTDKDYDDLIGINQLKYDNFFVTKWHSIEHYLATPHVFGRALRKFFSTVEEDDVKIHLHKFETAYNQFLNSLICREISTLTILDRSNPKECMSLDEIKMKDLFHLDNLEIVARTYKSIEEKEILLEDGCTKEEIGKLFFKSNLRTYCLNKSIVLHKKKPPKDVENERKISNNLLTLASAPHGVNLNLISILALFKLLIGEGNSEEKIANSLFLLISKTRNLNEANEIFRAKCQYLEGLDPRNFLRGKYIMWFFTSYYSKFRRIQGGTSVDISKDNAVKILSLLILKPDNIPDDIRRFLETNLASLQEIEHGNN